MKSVLPPGRIIPARARDVTVGTWLVPHGWVRDVHAPRRGGRVFTCAHPDRIRVRVVNVSASDDAVLVRAPIQPDDDPAVGVPLAAAA